METAPANNVNAARTRGTTGDVRRSRTATAVAERKSVATISVSRPRALTIVWKKPSQRLARNPSDALSDGAAIPPSPTIARAQSRLTPKTNTVDTAMTVAHTHERRSRLRAPTARSTTTAAAAAMTASLRSATATKVATHEPTSQLSEPRWSHRRAPNAPTATAAAPTVWAMTEYE
jgi:hypothetical protein